MTRFGVLGGTGPIATSRLFNRINSELALQGASLDSDYPEIIVTQIPIPFGNNTAHFTDNHVVQESLDILNHSQCDLILVNCNSIHDLLPKLDTTVPIVNNIATLEKQFPNADVFCSCVRSGHQSNT